MKNNYLCLTSILVVWLTAVGAHAQNPVKLHTSVEIGGINQWVGAKGDDDTKPLLLFLHGGPGFSSRAYSKKFVKRLKKDFIVAQWDQRETGITAAWSPFSDSLTLEMFHNDTEEVVNYLLKEFSKKKLYLVGFSWGGFLGMHFADQHPELLHAYVSVSGAVHNVESDRRTLALMKKKAAEENNTQAIREVAEIEIPFTSWEQLYYQRKWTAYFFAGKASGRQYPKSLFEEWSSKWLPLFMAASRVDFRETVPEMHCPVYFFLSHHDYAANHTVAEEYFNQLKAEQKQIVWFDEASHEIPSQVPKQFSEALISIANQPPD